MKTKLRILLIEDDVADAELISHELKSSGLAFALTRVQTEPEFRQEMASDRPDLILSDHGLPSFSGFRALEITRQEHPQLPFIFVSGSNDQGMVAQMHEAGATDYVFKRDIRDLKSAVLEALAPHQEEPPLPMALQAEPLPAQPEFKLELPPVNLEARIASPVPGHLFFCPRCHFAHDEAGRFVRLEDYCGNCAESIVVRRVCTVCAAEKHDLGLFG